MRIKEVCHGITDGSHNPPQGVASSEYLMLSSKNIFDDEITFDDPRFLSEEDFCKENKRTQISPGDVLLTIVGTVGRTAVVTEEMPAFTLQRSVAVLHPDKSICHERYLMYALRGKRSYIESRSKGVAQKGIYLGEVSEIDLPIPCIGDQLEITDNLDKASSIIRLRKEELVKLDDLIKARFVEMFGDPEYNGKVWPVKKLKDLCNIGSSKRIYQEEQTSDGIPFWRISDLVTKMDTGNVESSLYIPESRYEELRAQGLVPDSGDILVTSRGTLGRCYIISPEDRFYFQDGMISWLGQYKNEITPLYIKYLFDMPGFKKQIDSMQAGSTVAYLSIAMMKKLDIMLPNMEAQNKFAAFVAQVDKSKAAVQAALDQTQLLFDSLMQEYFG